MQTSERIMYAVEIGLAYSGTRWHSVRACRSPLDAVESAKRGIRLSEGIAVDRLHGVDVRPATSREIIEHFAARIESGLMSAEDALRMSHVYLTRAKLFA